MKAHTFRWGMIIVERVRAVLLIAKLLFFIWIWIDMDGLLSLVRLTFWIGQNIDGCTPRFRELLNVLLHTDIKALEKQVCHNQAQRILFPHFKEVLGLAFKIVLILTLDIVNVFIQELAKKLFSKNFSLSIIHSNGRTVSDS